MNSKYRSILFESKRLNGSGLLQKANAFNITADKILYDYALDMVSSSLIDLIYITVVIKKKYIKCLVQYTNLLNITY